MQHYGREQELERDVPPYYSHYNQAPEQQQAEAFEASPDDTLDEMMEKIVSDP